jgi:hypothetical protein
MRRGRHGPLKGSVSAERGRSAINNEFSAPVESPGAFIVPDMCRAFFAVASGEQACIIDAQTNQVLPGRESSAFPEGHVVFLASSLVAMAFDYHAMSGMLFEIPGGGFELAAFSRADSCAVEIEEDILEVDIGHYAARIVPPGRKRVIAFEFIDQSRIEPVAAPCAATGTHHGEKAHNCGHNDPTFG